MNRHGLLFYLCHWKALIVCSFFLPSVIITSCHKPATTQPPTDTTGHNVIWKSTLLGDVGASSMLNDVTIINDTLAFAVGQISLKDSNGQIDPSPYGIAVWNGSSWTMKRLFYAGNNLVIPIRGVFPFGANDVWLAAGSVFHWDGVAAQAELRFSRLSLSDPNGSVEKLWGSPNGHLYGIGNAGTIISYDGTSWQQLSSGTTLDIKDIFGAVNPFNGSTEIIAVAGNQFVGPEKAILGISGNQVTTLDTSGVNGPLTGIWFAPSAFYFAVGDGIYEKQSRTQSSWYQEPYTLTRDYTEAVRGLAWNDVFIVGDFGVVLHYNGATWMNYVAETGIAGAYHSVAVRGNLVIAVGENSPYALTLVGRRSP